MAKTFLVSIDLTKQQLQNAAIHNLATAPSAPSVGQVYFNTVDLQPYIWDGDSWNPFGVGTVTSVALSLPSIFTVSGSPVTTSGTLTATLASQTANTVFAAPNGAAGEPSFRALVAADIPNLDASKITTGLLSVARGGTGVGTLTGVVIGNGTSAMTAVAGTANQLLRRNAGNTAYEFFTPTYLTAAITSLNGLTAATQTFANDTNVTITSATSTHTIGWTGQLAVGRGGTGASTLTGVVIGNGASAMTAVAGTGSQVLRRNAGNTAYEFITPGTANTLATLDANGKVPTSQIPDSVLGQVEYINTWNASTNTPTLPAPTGVKGDYYVVSVAGTQTNANFEGGSLTFAVGDWVISNGTVWQKVDNTDAVVSVFGRIGAITADAADYNGFYVRHDTASQGLNTTQQSNARANIGIDTWYATRTFAQTIGDGTATTFNIDHNLNSRDVVVQVYNATTYEEVEVDVTRSTVNRVVIGFNIAPSASSYRVVVKI
jgi:hypothetical protein